MLVERQVRGEDDFMEIDSRIRSKAGSSKYSKDGAQEKWWEEEDRGPQNSQWAGLTQMPGSGVALGGKGFKPGDNSLPKVDIEDVLRRNDEVNGLIPARKKGKHLLWANINPNIEESR